MRKTLIVLAALLMAGPAVAMGCGEEQEKRTEEREDKVAALTSPIAWRVAA